MYHTLSYVDSNNDSIWCQLNNIFNLLTVESLINLISCWERNLSTNNCLSASSRQSLTSSTNHGGGERSTVSVSVYYVAVRTIALSRHGNNLARPVIIHDIIHSLIYVPSTLCCGFFGVSPDGNCAYVH